MTLSRSVTINTLAQYISRFLTILSSILTTYLLSRSLGQAGYGQFGVITTTILFFVTISDWGTQAISVREASRNSEKQQEIFASVAGLKLFLGCFTTLVYVIFVSFYPNFANFRLAALIGSPIILLLSLRTAGLVVHQTYLRLYLPAISEVANTLTFLTLIIIFLAQKHVLNLEFVLVAVTLGALVNCFFTIIPIFSSIKLKKFTLATVSLIVKESLPMGAFLVVFSVYNRVDTFILQAIKGNTATGVYTLSYKIHENLVLIAAYLMNSLYPLLSQNGKDTKRIFQKTFNLIFLAGSIVLVLGFIFSPLVIQILTGGRFADSSSVLRILIFATFISYLNHLTGYTLIAVGEQTISLIIGLLALAINVSLNLLLIPLYSYYAAAAVTIITEGFVFLASITYLIKKHKLQVKPRLLPQTVYYLIYDRSKLFI